MSSSQFVDANVTILTQQPYLLLKAQYLHKSERLSKTSDLMMKILRIFMNTCVSNLRMNKFFLHNLLRK